MTDQKPLKEYMKDNAIQYMIDSCGYSVEECEEFTDEEINDFIENNLDEIIKYTK